MRKLEELFHSGEIAIQEKYNEKPWPDSVIRGLNNMFREEFDEWMTKFVETQSFFFIGTADDQGECDCNFRGTELDEAGNKIQSVKVTASDTLVFPDYPGNNIYSTLGNLAVNPNIGMIFINFEKEIRLRVNGQTEIIETHAEWQKLWPKALRFVRVTVKHVYFNCPQRIKQSTMP